jgi:hypothetical protein
LSTTVKTRKVNLVTRQGEGVITTEIPDFNPLPEVLHWGSRYFVLHGNLAIGIKYVEANCYEVVGNITASGEVKDINA